MPDELLVECPIHLDAVPITDILVFKCGHGFCEPCLEAHFRCNAQGSQLPCPTCRKPVKRREAFSLFLSSAQLGSTQSSHSTQDASHARLTNELREVKAAHANCTGRFIVLQDEITGLRQSSLYHDQTVDRLRDRYEVLEGRCAKEADAAARAREECNRAKEEATRLQVENHKISKALEEAVKEVQTQLERVKMFQGYVERYKRRCDLERKKRKAMESANDHLPSKREDDSLMVVDSNAPDVLRQGAQDFAWLDEACKVKGDHLPGDEGMESASEDEVQLNLFDSKGKHKPPGPAPQHHVDWDIRLESLAGPSSGARRSKQVGGSRIVKVKMAAEKKTPKVPLTLDRQGRVKGLVALGSKQKFNSKN